MKKCLSLLLVLVLVIMLLPAGVLAAETEEEPLTRGELATLIVETLELEYDESMEVPFTDVPDDSEYYEAVAIVYHMGVMNGISSTQYSPKSNITKEQFATILYRIGLEDKEPDVMPDDMVSTSSYAYHGVKSVLAYGIMTVDENNCFNPKQKAYRSDADLELLASIFAPNTTGSVTVDISKDSVEIYKNYLGLNVVEQGDTQYTTKDNRVIVRQSAPTATANTITVTGNANITLMIAGINIEDTKGSALSIGSSAEVTLELVGRNTLVGYYEGICVKSGAALTITGKGSLFADGRVGIGSRNDCGRVMILSGTIIAEGNYFAVGARGESEGVTIAGGAVTATGDYALGDMEGGGVIVSGGTVQAMNSAYGIYSGEAVAISESTVSIEADKDGIYSDGAVVISDAVVSIDAVKFGIRADSISIANSQITGNTDYLENISCDTLSNTTALPGNICQFALEAYGASGLTYQWQSSLDNNTWTDLEGETKPTLSIRVPNEANVTYYRCQLTNGWGNVVYTNSAQIFALAFTEQPQDVSVGVGDMVIMTAEAVSSDVSYQWQRSDDEGKTWTDVAGEIYFMLLQKTTVYDDGVLYRCMITAPNGDQVASESARVTVDTENIVCQHENAVTEYTSDLENRTHTETVTCECGITVSTETTDCTDEDKDTFCDACGATIVELAEIDVVGANMTLGNDLKMNFMIKKSDMKEGYIAKVSQAGGESVELELWSYNSQYYAASYSVAAKEMTDVLSVEIYDADGYLVSNPFTRTIKEYAMTLLNNTSQKDSLKSVIVDMLNYGTEAQKYFGHNEDAYANAEVTEQQQTTYATADVECVNNQQSIQNFAGANLSLEDSILLNVFFKVTYSDALTATVSFTDYQGKEVVAEGELSKYSSMTKCVINQIVLADSRRPVTVTVYDGDTVVGQGVESVESYIARNLTSASTGAINMAIMKFAASAYAYLGGTN